MSNGIGYSQVKLKLTGISPLIVHNGQLADPLNRFSKLMKAVTGKRKKWTRIMRNWRAGIPVRSLHAGSKAVHSRCGVDLHDGQRRQEAQEGDGL